MKQSSIDWFYQRILAKDIESVFQQAKAMHKEEIVKSNRDGVDMVIAEERYITGEEYYNETFGGNNE